MGGLRALVVEDDPSVSRLFARMLEQAGRSVVAVERVTDALLALETGPFDEAFVDVELAEGGDGVALSLTLLSERPALRLVVMSGNPEGLQRAKEAGMNRRLSKPFTALEFSSLLGRD